MPCSRTLVALAVLSLGTLAAQAYASTRHHGMSVSIDGDQRVTSCDQLRVRSDREIARSEERLTLPGNAARIKAAQNGGIFVYGTDRKDIAVLTCKVAISMLPIWHSPDVSFCRIGCSPARWPRSTFN